MEIQLEEQNKNQQQEQVSKPKSKIQRKNDVLFILATAANISKNKNREKIETQLNISQEYNFLCKLIKLCSKHADYELIQHKKADRLEKEKQLHQLVKKFRLKNQYIQAQILMSILKYYSQERKNTQITIMEDPFQKTLSQLSCIFIQKNWKSKHFFIQEILQNGPFQVKFYLSILRGLSKNNCNNIQQIINLSKKSKKIESIQLYDNEVQQSNFELKKYCNEFFTHILTNFNLKISSNFPYNSQQIGLNLSHSSIQIQKKLIFILETNQLISFDESSYNQIMQVLSALFSQNSIFMNQLSPSSSQSYVWELYVQTLSLLIQSFYIIFLNNNLESVEVFISTILEKCNFWNVLQFLYTNKSALILKILVTILKVLNNNRLNCSKNDSFCQYLAMIIKNTPFQPSIQFMETLAQLLNITNQNQTQTNEKNYLTSQTPKFLSLNLACQNIIPERLSLIFQKELKTNDKSIEITNLIKQSILNIFFSRLSDNSISYMFKLLSCYQKYQIRKKCLQQLIFSIFLINPGVLKNLCKKEQFFLGIQTFLFQALRDKNKNQINLTFNNCNFDMKTVFFLILIEYFHKVFLDEHQQNGFRFKQQCIIEVAVDYPQLLKIQIFSIKNQDKNYLYTQDTQDINLQQKCFFKIIEQKPQIQLIQKIVYYLRKFKSKIKTLFIKYLYEKVKIDICSYPQFQSLSWHLIQSNVPLRKQKFSYIYENFLLKNQIKFAECLIGSSLATSHQKNCYNDLFNLYIQNCFLAKQENSRQGLKQLPVSGIILQYIKYNIEDIMNDFFCTNQSIKLYCKLMKYFLRCIYENMKVSVVFFVVLQSIHQFYDKIQNYLEIYFILDEDIKQFESMINQWKKVVAFYQKRNSSKYLLFTIFILQINFLNIFANFNRYLSQNLKITPFSLKLQQIQLKHKAFIVNLLLSWFQDESSKQNRNQKEFKSRSTSEIEEIICQIIQKVLVCSSLLIVQKQLIIQNFEMNEDQIWDLWMIIRQNFKSAIIKDQKQILQNVNPDNQFKNFKRQKLVYQEDEQENNEYSSLFLQKIKKRIKKNNRNIRDIRIKSKQKLIKDQILTDGSVLMNDFQLFKLIQKKMIMIQSSSQGLAQKFQKSLNLSDIVKVQKKFRNIIHVKKY